MSDLAKLSPPRVYHVKTGARDQPTGMGAGRRPPQRSQSTQASLRGHYPIAVPGPIASMVLAAAVFAHGRAELDDDGLAQLGEHDADGERGRRSHGLLRASCLASKARFKASVGPRFEAIWRGRGPPLAGSATGRVGHRRCEAAAIAERTRWSRSTPHQHFGACPHGDVKSP